MKFYCKNDAEIELLRKSNLLVSKTLGEIGKLVKPGVTTLKLDRFAEEYLRDHGGVPGFLGYKGFPNTLCTSVNSEVVHGIPSNRELQNGDIVSIDCGVILNDFYGDSAFTFEVGEVDSATKELLTTTKQSLYKGIEKAICGNRLGDVGHAIQSFVEDKGYSVVREMVGHGIGKKMHEPPEVPNFGKQGRGNKLQKGMTICIEPMINLGKKNIKGCKDGWTIRTTDGKPSAHFELAIAITGNNNPADILSTFKYIEEQI